MVRGVVPVHWLLKESVTWLQQLRAGVARAGRRLQRHRASLHNTSRIPAVVRQRKRLSKLSRVRRLDENKVLD